MLPRQLSRLLHWARAPVMAPPRCFALELPGWKLAHFTLASDSADGDQDAAGAGGDSRLFAELLGPSGRSYSLCVPVAPDADCGARVRAARLHQRLLHQLRHGPFQQCQLRRLLCYCRAGGAGGVQHGVLLHEPRNNPHTRGGLLELMNAYHEGPSLRLAEFVGDQSLQVQQYLWERRGDQKWQKAGGQRILLAPEPKLHPVVPDLPVSAVFPNREAARAVLEECTSFIPEARTVLDLVDQCPKQIQKGKFPVIVIEGLDATGKTTVTQSVSDSLKAVLLKSPPACIEQLRKGFDDEPTIIKRAFYSLGNYIVASEIARESTKSPVIVDRYWHSTAAYAIATEVSGSLQHLPPVHHPIYQWPQDLLKPDLVLLLTVSPEERMQRLAGRGLEKTKEEAELETNNVFRQKVEETYRRMENPNCHVVDANSAKEMVLQMVLGIIQTKCDNL